MEILPMVQVVPEMNLALDPVSGVVGASLGSGVVILSMDDINEQVSKLCDAAEELERAFDPHVAPVGSYPGRDGAHLTAARLTNTAYGFVITSVIIFAALPLIFSILGGL